MPGDLRLEHRLAEAREEAAERQEARDRDRLPNGTADARLGAAPHKPRVIPPWWQEHIHPAHR
jgi:hypothetical protein